MIRAGAARKGVVGIMIGAVALVLGAGPAFAEQLVIRKVDTTGFPKVRLNAIVDGPSPNLASFELRENGQLVHGLKVVPAGKAGVPIGTVLAIDSSAAMGEVRLDQAKAAAHQIVAGKLPSEQLAVVSMGERPDVVSDLTSDPAQLDRAIDKLTPQGKAALWDGLARGIALFDTRADLQPNLIVVSGSGDQTSTATAAQVKAQALDAHASVLVVGLEGAPAASADTALRSIVKATDGRYVSLGDAGQLPAQATFLQSTLQQNQYQIDYTSTSSAKGTLDFELTSGPLSAQARAISPGTVAEGQATRPVVDTPKSVGFLGGSLGKLFIVLLVLAAAGLAAFAGITFVTERRNGLSTALKPYEHGRVDDDDAEDPGMAQTAFMRRAVGITTKLAEDRGVLERVEVKLEKADLPLRPAEALTFYIAGVAILTLAAGFRSGLFAGLAALVVASMLPILVLKALAARRSYKFRSQLPDMLQLLAGALRAGFSLLQALDSVAREVPNPMGYELNRILVETRLGRPLEEALDDAAGRLGGDDFAWAVMAIRIQREVGGNLAELLDTVAETMIQRERLRRDIKTLTAEGRLSAIILVLLPVGLGLFMYVVNPAYIGLLFSTRSGKVMLSGSIVVASLGAWWMKKIIEIEV